MAQYTKQQLISASNATYFTNVNGGISASAVRDLNDSWVSSSALLSGSNTFIGNQIISGTMTAQLPANYIWLGDSNGYNQAVATSSISLQGAQGIQGLQGTQGTQGIQGIQGLQGLQGLQGIQGLQGTQGIQGITGLQGIQGIEGASGSQGTQGTQGIQGITGLSGSNGAQGAQGIQGVQGTQGDSVSSGSLLVTASFDTTTRDITFTKGDATTFKLGAFATTGSNTFTAPQTISTAVNSELNLIATPGFQTNVNFQSDSSNFRAYGDFNINNNGQYGGSGSIKMLAKDNEMVFAASQGFNLGVTNALGNGIEGGAIRINVPSGSQQLQLTGSLNVSNTLTASLQQGYAWVGNGSNVSTLVATSSFGTSIDTGSFATTGSNTFTGVNTFNERTNLQGINVYTGSASGIYIGDRTTFAPTSAGNIPGNQHTVVGQGALNSFGNGDLNAAFGPNALYVLVSGSSNLAMGGFAGYALVNGNTNTFIGDQAGNGMKGGDNNFFLGSSAGNNFRTGSYNIMIGLNTAGNLATGSGNLFIGTQGGTLIENNVDNQLSIKYGTDLSPRRLLYKSGSEAANLYLYGGLEIQNTLTASLTQGYAWVGDNNNRTTLVATSSFGTSINTGSFATTGSNTFYGSQTISGSVLPLSNFGGSLGSSGQNWTNLYVNEIQGLSNLRVDTIKFNGVTLPLASSQPRQLFGNGIDADTAMYYATSSANVNALRELAYVQSGSATTPDMNILSASFATTIASIVTGTGFATTGSNTFTGDQNILGSLTASLQQGYAWVGNSSNVSTLVATSSFGSGGGTIDTGSFLTTGSLAFGGSTNKGNGIYQFNIATGSAGYAIEIFNTGSDALYGGTGSMRFGITDPGNPFIQLKGQPWFQFGTGNQLQFQSFTSSYDNGIIIGPYYTSSAKVHLMPRSSSLQFSQDIGSGEIPIFTLGTHNGVSQSIFEKDLRVKGQFTASLQQGYAWVGNSGGVSSLVATSSFGGGTTYINPTLNPYSGSLILVANTFTSSSFAHISASANGQVNLVFKNNNNTADTIISGSGNIFTNPIAPQTGFKRFATSGNISLSGNLPQMSGSMAFPITMSNNYFGSVTGATFLGMRGPVSSSAWSINNNIVQLGVNIGSSAALHAEKLVSGLTLNSNNLLGSLNLIANQSALSSSVTINGNIIAGATTLNLSSSAAALANNIINDSNFTLTNQYYSSSLGLGSVSFNRNNIGGQNNLIIISGSLPVGGAQSNSISDNFIFGGSNTIYIDVQNARLSGTAVYKNVVRTGLMGNNLIVSGSSLFTDLSSVGSVFVGRYNADDNRRNKTSDVVFAVGTGNTTTRKTGFLIDSGSNTYVEGTFNVSGSTAMTGSLVVSSFTTLASVSSSLNFADDTAAAAGGVPLGGLYRNGNFVMIRLT